MDWDQRAFAWLYRLFRRASGRAGKQTSPCVVEETAPRFEVLCQLLSGRRWEVAGGGGMGGVAPGKLVLPRELSWLAHADDRAAFYLYRVVLGVTAVDLGLRSRSFEDARSVVVERYPGAGGLAARVDALVAAAFPFEELGSPWGEVLPDDQPWPAELDPPDDPQSTLPSGSERKMKDRPSDIEYVDLESQKDKDNPLVHSFEKVHTATEYESGRKQLDGSDQLAEHEEALEELDLRKVTRTAETAESVYDADLQSGLQGTDLDDDPESSTEHRYPEWNFKRREYRSQWCTVYEHSSPARGPASDALVSSRRLHGQVLRLQAELKRLALDRRWRNRQLDGAEVDIDALVDRQADLSAKRHPDPRIYVRKKRHDAELAVLVLIDASLSSDSWVAGRRVFDIVRDSAQVLVEAFEPTSAKLCVSAFYSNTRRDCRFVLVKGFDAPATGGLERLHSVQPSGYTRIGPALRHALHLVERSGARRRLVLLLTDAKPTDYDHYEGRYGVEDVRQALREASERGVHCLSLTVRDRSEPYLTQMFGSHGWTLLPDARVLPERFMTLASEFLTR